MLYCTIIITIVVASRRLIRMIPSAEINWERFPDKRWGAYSLSNALSSVRRSHLHWISEIVGPAGSPLRALAPHYYCIGNPHPCYYCKSLL